MIACVWRAMWQVAVAILMIPLIFVAAVLSMGMGRPGIHGRARLFR